MNRSWQARPPLLTRRFAHDVATADDTVYVSGGTDGDTLFGSVEARSTRGSGNWRTVAPMNTPRGNHAAGVVKGIMYVAGGIVADDKSTDKVERYDPGTDEWTASRPLPAVRALASAAGLDGLLYVAGGVTNEVDPDEHATDSVLAYDPHADQWSTVAPMLTPRARFRLVAAGGHLYAVGGLFSDLQFTLRTVDRYSPKTDTWEAVRSMREPRGLPGAAVLTDDHGDRIVVVGGASGGFLDRLARDRTTEVYEVRTGKWHMLSTLLPHATGSLVCARAGDDVLAIGGNANIDGALVTVPDVLSLDLGH